MPWSNFTVAIIIGVVALIIVGVFLIKTIPYISTAVNSVIGGLKKPICCQMIGCKPAGANLGANANPLCTAFCFGVCG